MKWNYFPLGGVIVFGVVSILFIAEAPSAANDTKGTKPDQHQGQDKRTTKQKLEGPTKDRGAADFKELNKHAPGGPTASPAVEGSKSGGAGSGTGSGTGTTGAAGGSGGGSGGGS